MFRNSTHRWEFLHAQWTSSQRDKNDLVIEMTEDIAKGSRVRESFKKVMVNNPDASLSIASFDDVRKQLYAARKKNGGVPLPQDGFKLMRFRQTQGIQEIIMVNRLE